MRIPRVILDTRLDSEETFGTLLATERRPRGTQRCRRGLNGWNAIPFPTADLGACRRTRDRSFSLLSRSRPWLIESSELPAGTELPKQMPLSIAGFWVAG